MHWRFPWMANTVQKLRHTLRESCWPAYTHKLTYFRSKKWLHSCRIDITSSVSRICWLPPGVIPRIAQKVNNFEAGTMLTCQLVKFFSQQNILLCSVLKQQRECCSVPFTLRTLKDAPHDLQARSQTTSTFMRKSFRRMSDLSAIHRS